MGLNPKQKLFVKEYLIDGNATRAAKAAGYSVKTAYSQGHDLLKKPEIKEMLARSVQKVSDKLDISAERILQRIAKVAFAEHEAVKNSDVLKACELLGKNQSLFTENVNVNNTGPTAQVVIHIPPNTREVNK